MVVLRNRRTWLGLGLPLVVIAAGAMSGRFSTGTAAQPGDARSRAALEKEVRALFENHCYRCHSHQSGKSKGELMLDSMASMRKGGATAPAVVPGDLDKSLLYKAVLQVDEDLKMPQKGKLTNDEIALIRDWIKAGAPWTDEAPKHGLRAPGQITDADRKYWSFQPVKAVPPPEVADPAWARNPIDRFIRSRLDAEGLKPSPPADRRALVRRVYFDLTGLPPSPADIEAFVSDPAPDAFETLVDKLLASPRYGEQMARHWLDLVRYAESDGFRLDAYRPNAWQYRDYVIRAFNADKPYDRFVREQLAGDEMAPDDPEAIIATGYLCHGIYEYNQRDARTQWDNMLSEITDVTADAFLGLGFACARCHDHKYDPILQKDYYRMRAFFAALMPSEDVPLGTPAQLAERAKKQAVWLEKTARVREAIAKLEADERDKATNFMLTKFPREIQALVRKPAGERTPLEHQLATLAYRQVQYELDRLDARIKGDAKARLIELRKELAKFDSDRPPTLPMAPASHDVGTEAPPTMIPKRHGPPIEPALPTVLGDAPLPIESPPGLQSTGRRLALAQWITRPDHPLTSRVIVNRLWQQHFGRGIVATANDFGNLGDKPSHPELLDWLADRFVKDGWSVKKMHRLMVTSQTYRQSATAHAEDAALKKDPENRLVWRMTTRRLTAEQIRDAILAVTGKLDLIRGGPSVEAREPRRSIYTKVMRNTHDPLLDVFDVPETFTSTAQRNVTTTPTQALLMINSPFMHQQAQAFAARLQKDAAATDDARIDAAFRLVFGRSATPQQKEQVQTFLAEQAKRMQAKTSAAAVPEVARLPFHDGRAVVISPGGNVTRFEVPDGGKLPAESFTLEGFVLLRSVYDDGMIRPIAAHWDGDSKGSGWAFGVTGKKSSYKPQMLVLQLWGENGSGQPSFEAVFSGLQLTLNRPYYVAVSVKLREAGEAGVTFYARDLSNDEEPLQSYQAPHQIVKMKPAHGPFTIGGTAGKQARTWDGLIDDVRLSAAPLSAKQLLVNADGVGKETVGFWQFEQTPGMLKDSSPNGLHLQRIGVTEAVGPADPRQAALMDLCLVLLNANEFLYVD